MRAAKVVISVFLLYHLTAIFLLPMSSSLPGRRLARYFTAYANTLGMNTAWNFFSPGPSPMFYLQYEIELANGVEANDGEPYIYPPVRRRYSFDDSWNRRFFGMRYFALDSERLAKFLVPFLCRQVAGAQAIYIQSVFERIQDIEKPEAWADYPDMTERVNLPRQRHSCVETGEQKDPSS